MFATMGTTMTKLTVSLTPDLIWIELVRCPGQRAAQLARNLGVSYSTVRWWLPRMCACGYGVAEDDTRRLYPEIPAFDVDCNNELLS
jgi:hypothetical protein